MVPSQTAAESSESVANEAPNTVTTDHTNVGQRRSSRNGATSLLDASYGFGRI
jgi:hypothetical protein